MWGVIELKCGCELQLREQSDVMSGEMWIPMWRGVHRGCMCSRTAASRFDLVVRLLYAALYHL